MVFHIGISYKIFKEFIKIQIKKNDSAFLQKEARTQHILWQSITFSPWKVIHDGLCQNRVPRFPHTESSLKFIVEAHVKTTIRSVVLLRKII